MAGAEAILNAVIFDFDGVLVDSVAVKTESFAALYEDYGSDVQRRVVDYHLQNKGISREKKFVYYQQELIGGNTDEETLTSLAKKFADLVKHRVITCDEIAGSGAVLRWFDKKVPMYVASGTPELELKEIISARGLDRYFQEICGSPKSKIDILATIIASGNYDRSRCVMVGDARTDFAAAEENKCRFIGVGSEAEMEFPANTVVLPDLTGFVATVATLFETPSDLLVDR